MGAADYPAIASRPPNIVLLITDQQRYPRHWPDGPGWLRELMPNDAELARTGLAFERAFCSASMCSPSRATLFTGRYPAEHGVELTLTAADLKPDPRNAPSVAAKALEIARRPGAPREMVLRGFLRGMFQLGPKSGGEQELPPDVPNLATVLGARGYTVAYKGKWHLTHPSGAATGEGLLGGWTERDSERIEREYGFADWEVPDAGENTKAENFGGGNAGPSGEGWDEEYTRQVEAWLARERLPEPFCLVISLVNPHDVLGYPAQMRIGGYSADEFADLEVGLPPTADEELLDKPRVQTLMQMGMNAYLGPLRSREAKLEYVNFYAHLHRVIDRKIGRILAALGDRDDPRSLRSRTLIVRTSDHGEMGLSHGGLRQKAFNAYEETIHVPLVVSNPVLFPEPARTPALASLVDVLPTLAALAGAELDGAGIRGQDLTPVLAHHAAPKRSALRRAGADLGAIAKHRAPAPSVQDQVHFTYDDHQAGTALQEAPGQPNRVRCVRTADAKYALYFDPEGRKRSEHELYDLERDPDERRNLVDRDSAEARDGSDRGLRDEMRERLETAMDACATAPASPTRG
jgi:arylsulfatase A-like enzyme